MPTYLLKVTQRWSDGTVRSVQGGPEDEFGTTQAAEVSRLGRQQPGDWIVVEAGDLDEAVLKVIRVGRQNKP